MIGKEIFHRRYLLPPSSHVSFLAMRKTLYLYIFREIPPPFLLGMVTFTFVLLMGRLLKLTSMVVEKGVPLNDVLRMILYLLPSFCLVTIPMALLLAVLLAFSRLSGDSEITAMKACGISLYGLLPPALLFTFLIYLVGTYINVYAVPWGNTSFRKLLVEVIETRTAVALKEKIFNGDFPGIILYTDTFDPRSRVMEGVLIHDERDPQDLSTIFARQGVIVTDAVARTVRLHLTDGGIHRAVGKSGYRLAEFQNYDLSISLDKGSRELVKKETEMTLAELRTNQTSTLFDARMKRDMAMELNRRFALPFACFVLALVAIPLGIQNRRSGKAGGFSMSIGILLLYYIVLSASETLGEQGIIAPFAAIWAPNLLFIILGIYLFRKTAAEQQIPLLELFPRLAGRLRGFFSRRRLR
jgi:lipopolysaccharide export system permease protein